LKESNAERQSQTREEAMLLNSGLWQRIRSFEFDRPGDQFPFSARLARENGWSRDRALRAINEYRKFMYLICVAPTPLTPSEAVDQVWHLHLVYTRSYWSAFCDGVLGRRIHHEPTKGGTDQTDAFHDQYAETRRLYETEFGDLPPDEFWPPVAERFAETPRLQWVDRRRHWVLPKLRLPGLLPGLLIGTSVLTLLLASGTLHAATEAVPAPGTKLGDSDWVSNIIGGVFVFVMFLLFGRAIIDNARKAEKEEKDDKKSSWWWGTGCGGCSGCGGCGGCGG
jgi:hypothetical protein